MLNSEERAELRRYLTDGFSKAQLIELAFDLNYPYHQRPHEPASTLAEEMVQYLERQRRLACLVSTAVRQQSNPQIVNLLDKLPPCEWGTKLQVILPQNSLEQVNRFRESLVNSLGLEPEQVELLAAAWGSMRLLVGIHVPVVDYHMLLPQNRRQWEHLPVISVIQFITLKPMLRQVWRFVFEQAPLQRDGDYLTPTISWQEALSRFEQVRRSGGSSTAVPSPATSSPPSATVSVSPPYSTMAGNPMPIPGHTRNDGRYQWFRVGPYASNDLLPQIQPGDWLLADTRPDADLWAVPNQLVLLMVDSQIRGTIPLIPHQPLSTSAQLALALLTPRSDISIGVVGDALLTPTMPPLPVRLSDITGVVVGSWRPIE